MTTTKLTRETLRGVWHALLTPWDDNFDLDEKRFAEEINCFAGSGIHGMYTGGTTGEFYAQDDKTFERITAIACGQAHAIGLPIQIGCTETSTKQVCNRIAYALTHGADAIQLGMPYWLALQDSEVDDYFAAICDAAGDTPIVLYQTMRNKRRIENAQLEQLADKHPTFIGMKDTGGELDDLEALCKGPSNLAVFGGEPDLVDRMKRGTRGTYASVTGLNAPLIVKMYNLAAAGNYDEAAAIQKSIARLLDEVLIPYVHEGYLDSSLDRLMRVAGGGQVGLACQPPYKHLTQEQFEQFVDWIKANEPALLQA